MKVLIAVSFFALLLGGCAKQQKAEDQAGAAQSAYSDVLGSDRGYIVENAKFAVAGDESLFSIGNNFRLSAGASSVLILREKETEGRPGYILALQFPAFAAGTTKDYAGDVESAQYWAIGYVDGKSVVSQTGLISGSLRFVKTNPSNIDLGLNRDIMDGVGDIEIVVANIMAEGMKLEEVKKFAARFQLPMISLQEFAKITQPA